MSVGILGYGYYLPELVVTNQEIAQRFNKAGSWIEERTGIQGRRNAGRDTSTSDLAAKAAFAALNNANLTPADIDLIIVSTTTPDMLLPSTAVGVAILTSIIQQRTPWHYANIATNATPWSYTIQSFEPLTSLFQGLGLQAPEAQMLNLLTLFRIAQEKAAVLAFQDAFYVNVLMGLIGIVPAFFLVQKPILVLIRKKTEKQGLRETV